MIYIITGPVNSGKSTYLLSLYNRSKIGDGFYLKKLFDGQTYIGQEIICLSTNISMPFSYLHNYIPTNWDEAYRYDKYSFSLSAFAYARNISDSYADPFFLDELGPLEIQNKGLYDIFNKLLAANNDIYVVIRDNCLSDIINKFDLKNYMLV